MVLREPARAAGECSSRRYGALPLETQLAEVSESVVLRNPAVVVDAGAAAAGSVLEGRMTPCSASYRFFGSAADLVDTRWGEPQALACHRTRHTAAAVLAAVAAEVGVVDNGLETVLGEGSSAAAGRYRSFPHRKE